MYLLGTLAFEDAMALQRRLVYDVSGDRSLAFLILCEHSPLITVGRQGSRASILFDPDELQTRRWAVRWVNRGGGCLLHVPGQMVFAPVLALDHLGIGLDGYLDQLRSVLTMTLADFGVTAYHHPDSPALWVGDRPIAELGIAVNDWVAYYGGVCNINPDLVPFRFVRSLARPAALGAERFAEPMTSLERERHGPLRPALVRQRFIEHFADGFGFDNIAMFFHHPALPRKAPTDAVATSS